MTQREMEKLADIVVTKLLMTLSSVNDAVQDQELNFLSNIITSDSEYDKKACDFYDAQFNRLYLEPLYNQRYPELLFESLLQKNLIKPIYLS